MQKHRWNLKMLLHLWIINLPSLHRHDANYKYWNTCMKVQQTLLKKCSCTIQIDTFSCYDLVWFKTWSLTSWQMTHFNAGGPPRARVNKREEEEAGSERGKCWWRMKSEIQIGSSVCYRESRLQVTELTTAVERKSGIIIHTEWTATTFNFGAATVRRTTRCRSQCHNI